jgi:hypothetical protein
MSSPSPLTPVGIACLTVGVVLAVFAVAAAAGVMLTKPAGGTAAPPGQPRLPAPPTQVSVTPAVNGVSVQLSVAAPTAGQMPATGVVVSAAPASAPGAACPAQPPSGASNAAVAAPPGGGPVLPPVFMAVPGPAACVWVATVGGDGSGSTPYAAAAPVVTPRAVATGGPPPVPLPQLPSVSVQANPGPPPVVVATATGGTQPDKWLVQWQVDGSYVGSPVAWSPTSAVLAQQDTADTHVYTAVLTIVGDATGASAQGAAVVGGSGSGPPLPTVVPVVGAVTPVGSEVMVAFSWADADDSTQPAPPGTVLAGLQFSLDGGATFVTVDGSLLDPPSPYPPVNGGSLVLGAAQGLQPGGQYNLVLAATETLTGGTTVQTLSSPSVTFSVPSATQAGVRSPALPSFRF